MSRPWENVAPRPWEVAQPLYDRIVSVHRTKTGIGTSDPGQVGNVGYVGREQTTSPSSADGETILFTGLAASIQMRRSGRTRGSLLPADVTDKPEWQILIPAASLPQYSIRDRDILVDDEGYRYGVSSNYFTSFGYQLSCIRLET